MPGAVGSHVMGGYLHVKMWSSLNCERINLARNMKTVNCMHATGVEMNTLYFATAG